MKRILTSLLLVFSLYAISWSKNINYNEASCPLPLTGIKIGSIQSGSGSGGDPLYSSFCGSFYRMLKIAATNLIEDADPVYILPENVPALYVSYNFYGITGVIPIQKFYYSHHESQEAGQPIYIAWPEIYGHAEELCAFLETVTTGPTYTYMPWQFSLITEDGEFYPVQDYTGPDEIFSCNVFDVPCSYDPLYTPTWAAYGGLNCSCEVDDDEPFQVTKVNTPISIDPLDLTPYSSSTEINTIEQFNEKQESNIDINIENTNTNSQYIAYPNPFSTTINLEIDIEKNTNLEITIIDTNGKLITRLVDKASEGVYRKEMSSDFWAKGVYFIKIKMGTTNKVIRIVKV